MSTPAPISTTDIKSDTATTTTNNTLSNLRTWPSRPGGGGASTAKSSGSGSNKNSWGGVQGANLGWDSGPKEAGTSGAQTDSGNSNAIMSQTVQNTNPYNGISNSTQSQGQTQAVQPSMPQIPGSQLPSAMSGLGMPGNLPNLSQMAQQMGGGPAQVPSTMTWGNKQFGNNNAMQGNTSMGPMGPMNNMGNPMGMNNTMGHMMGGPNMGLFQNPMGGGPGPNQYNSNAYQMNQMQQMNQMNNMGQMGGPGQNNSNMNNQNQSLPEQNPNQKVDVFCERCKEMVKRIDVKKLATFYKWYTTQFNIWKTNGDVERRDWSKVPLPTMQQMENAVSSGNCHIPEILASPDSLLSASSAGQNNNFGMNNQGRNFHQQAWQKQAQGQANQNQMGISNPALMLGMAQHQISQGHQQQNNQFEWGHGGWNNGPNNMQQMQNQWAQNMQQMAKLQQQQQQVFNNLQNQNQMAGNNMSNQNNQMNQTISNNSSLANMAQSHSAQSKQLSKLNSPDNSENGNLNRNYNILSASNSKSDANSSGPDDGSLHEGSVIGPPNANANGQNQTVKFGFNGFSMAWNNNNSIGGIGAGSATGISSRVVDEGNFKGAAAANEAKNQSRRGIPIMPMFNNDQSSNLGLHNRSSPGRNRNQGDIDGEAMETSSDRLRRSKERGARTLYEKLQYNRSGNITNDRDDSRDNSNQNLSRYNSDDHRYMNNNNRNSTSNRSGGWDVKDPNQMNRSFNTVRSRSPKRRGTGGSKWDEKPDVDKDDNDAFIDNLLDLNDDSMNGDNDTFDMSNMVNNGQYNLNQMSKLNNMVVPKQGSQISSTSRGNLPFLGPNSNAAMNAAGGSSNNAPIQMKDFKQMKKTANKAHPLNNGGTNLNLTFYHPGPDHDNVEKPDRDELGDTNSVQSMRWVQQEFVRLVNEFGGPYSTNVASAVVKEFFSRHRLNAKIVYALLGMIPSRYVGQMKLQNNNQVNIFDGSMSYLKCMYNDAEWKNKNPFAKILFQEEKRFGGTSLNVVTTNLNFNLNNYFGHGGPNNIISLGGDAANQALASQAANNSSMSFDLALDDPIDLERKRARADRFGAGNSNDNTGGTNNNSSGNGSASGSGNNNSGNPNMITVAGMNWNLSNKNNQNSDSNNNNPWSAFGFSSWDDEGDEWKTSKLNSKALRGELDAMCSQSEIRDREQTRQLDRFEIDVQKSNLSDPNIAPVAGLNLCVKKYQRSSADKQYKAPDIRTLGACYKTVKYLFTDVIDLDVTPKPSIYVFKSIIPFMQIYSFIRDRIRAVRVDLHVQQPLSTITEEYIKTHEAALRFELVSNILVKETYVQDVIEARLKGTEKYDEKLAMKAISQTVEPLLHAYKAVRAVTGKSDGTKIGGGLDELEVNEGSGAIGPRNRPSSSSDASTAYISPDEAAVRRYAILLQIGSSEQLFSQLAKLPDEILSNSLLQEAVTLFTAFQSNDYVAFFRFYRNCDLLSGIAISGKVDLVRYKLMCAIVMAANAQIGDEIPLKKMMEKLCLVDEYHAKMFFRHLGLECKSKEVKVSSNNNGNSIGHGNLKGSAAAIALGSSPAESNSGVKVSPLTSADSGSLDIDSSENNGTNTITQNVTFVIIPKRQELMSRNTLITTVSGSGTGVCILHSTPQAVSDFFKPFYENYGIRDPLLKRKFDGLTKPTTINSNSNSSSSDMSENGKLLTTVPAKFSRADIIFGKADPQPSRKLNLQTAHQAKTVASISQSLSQNGTPVNNNNVNRLSSGDNLNSSRNRNYKAHVLNTSPSVNSGHGHSSSQLTVRSGNVKLVGNGGGNNSVLKGNSKKR